MPFKDPAARAAYMRRYHAKHQADYMERYLEQPDPIDGTKREKVRRRKAGWFQSNRARLTARKRRLRRSAAMGERVSLALGLLAGATVSRS